MTLNNGVQMPRIGFGTYRLTDPKTSILAIKHAIDAGYLMLDTAEYYQNHHLIAQAIKESSKKREELFITSKIWPNEKDPQLIRARIYKILEELNTDYLDLLLVHWPLPYGFETYRVLEEFYKKGIIRAIGVSNYDYEQLKVLLSKVDVKPVVNQIELHPNTLRRDVVDLAHRNNIAITSWQTLMNGEVGKLRQIALLANKYKVDPAAVALNWAFQQNIIVIPKSATLSRIESNLKSLDRFNLTPQEIKEINSRSQDIKPTVNSKEFIAK